MRKLLLFVTWLAASNMVFSNNLSALDRGDFEKAQNKAKDEGKLLFIDFYAAWCSPCKWMDETTFKDPMVTSTLTEKFVAIKVNIDDFEGFELKSKFDVRYLPTILIFNSNGTMIERVEETLGSGKMKSLLDESILKNNAEIVHAVNTAPSEIFHNKLKTKESIVNEDETIEEKPGFKLQVGVFSSVQNASKFTKNLKRKFVEPISISEVRTNGKIIYKVLLGNFKSQQDAENFQQMLTREFKMDSIII